MRRLAALGVLNPGIAYALGLIGLTTITASMSVLLWALEPVAIMLLAALVLREHIPLALAAAVAVAITGVLLVVYQPGATGDAVGITLTVVSVGFCALYSVLTRRLLLDDSSLTVVLAQQAAALVFAVALATVVGLVGGPGWDLRATVPGTGWPRQRPASCTTAPGSGSSSPACVRCPPRWPARSCPSSRCSGSRPGTWSGSGSSRGSGSARSSSSLLPLRSPLVSGPPRLTPRRAIPDTSARKK